MEKDKRKLLGLMMGLSVLFFVLVWSVWLAGPLTAMDEQIMQWVMGVCSPLLTDVFLFFTVLGSMRVIIYFGAAVLLALLLFKRWRSMQFLIASVVVGELLERILKITIGRTRPDASFSLISSDGYAFPSGHATTAMVFYGALLFILWSWCQKRWQKNGVAFLAAMLILLVGLSRIYLGVHWMSDVLGGWLLGAITLLIIFILHKRF